MILVGTPISSNLEVIVTQQPPNLKTALPQNGLPHTSQNLFFSLQSWPMKKRQLSLLLSFPCSCA
ncbi:hypothetical protein MPNT_150053 [Candidatus Methylacidithermus pantelleriae]|uniref:Uncharacterized protein n=1 Tax=Candidatus Methylacidithermus pantelleriae TaxID=2744239 RepID=A0A8J2BH82_9BACT|nr:hypothetical protein MPNT_150053 [Candidatus Methylacidithermus pantelleriae]